MKRILLVCETLEAGGAERQVVTDAALLDRDGWDVNLVSWAGGPMETHVPRSVHQYRLNRDSWRGRLSALLGVCRECRPRVMQSHLTGANLLASVAGRRLGVPVVVTEHGLGLWRADKVRYRAAVATTYLAAKEIQCVCETTRRVKVDMERAPVAKTTVAYNCFSRSSVADAAAGAALRGDLRIPGDAFVILFVGRLIDVKRPDLLMATAARLLGQSANAHLLIAGDGPWRGRIEEWSCASGLQGRLKLAGIRSDMKAVYGAADVLVLTSEREALSLALLEAAASSVPAVAFDVGGNPEVVEGGRTGFVVPFGDESAFAARLTMLAGDAELRLVMGRAAAERAERLFSPEARLRALESCYARLLSGEA